MQVLPDGMVVEHGKPGRPSRHRPPSMPVVMQQHMKGGGPGCRWKPSVSVRVHVCMHMHMHTRRRRSPGTMAMSAAATRPVSGPLSRLPKAYATMACAARQGQQQQESDPSWMSPVSNERTRPVHTREEGGGSSPLTQAAIASACVLHGPSLQSPPHLHACMVVLVQTAMV